MQVILTPEQELALQEYTHSNVYPLRRSKVDQARELVDEILAKRDELARVLGLDVINIDFHIHNHTNPECNLIEAGYVLSQAVELKENDSSIRQKYCMIGAETWGNVQIMDYDQQLDITLYGVNK